MQTTTSNTRTNVISTNHVLLWKTKKTGSSESRTEQQAIQANKPDFIVVRKRKTSHTSGQKKAKNWGKTEPFLRADENV